MNNHSNNSQKMGIRVCGFCVALLLCLCVLALPASAQNSDDQSTSSVDVVILMDHSNSMEYNDKDSYRIDAAQMFISMCDMNSRVAFVPFAGSILDGADTRFSDISDEISRSDKLNEIEKYRLTRNQSNQYKIKPNTDFGQALNYAVKLIADRENKDNNPMIILLTDGNNSFKDRNNVTVTVWEDTSKSFVEKSYKVYTPEDANTLYEYAILGANENKTPIYTLAIPDNLSNSNEQYTLDEELRRISVLTGVGDTFTTLSADNVAELPQYFGNMLANKIGSNLIHNLTPTLLDEKQGTYQIVLPILNSSVYEANIYIPTKHIDATSIRLFSPNRKDLSSGVKDVIFKFSCKEFLLYKVIRPQELGDWTLEFTMKDANSVPENITFSILYNYNINLKTQLGQEFSDLQNVDEGITIGKGQTLHIRSRFYNVDGTQTNDPNLYAEWPGDAWKTIRCKYEIYNSNEVLLKSGDLDNGLNAFDGSVDLSAAYLDAEGYNAFTEGDYTLRIIADGAGLHRENELKMTLTNTLPVSANGSSAKALTYRLFVDDSALPETREIQTLSERLSEKIIDPDNDKLYFSLVPVSNTNVFPLTLNGDTIQGQTVKDPDTGLFLSGKAQYNLIVSDSPTRSGVTWDVSVNVVSVMQQRMERYQCETQVTGYDTATHSMPKCSSITFTMNLLDTTTGTADTTGMINNYSGKLLVYNANDTSVPLDSLTMEADGNGKISSTYTPSSHEQTLSFRCEYTMNNFSQTVAYSDLQALKIVNEPPTADSKVIQSIPKEIRFNASSPLILLVDKPTPDDKMVISLTELFSDADLCDTLDYIFPQTDENSMAALIYDEVSHTLTLVPQHNGTFALDITAQDLDQEKVTVSRSIKVTDLAAKWLRLSIITGIALVAIILLFVTVHQLRKPYFSYNTKLAVYETGAVVESEIRDLLHTKKTLLLSNLIDVSIAERNDVSTNMLTNIQLKPLSAHDGSIQVQLTATTNDFIVKLEEVEVKRKYVQWSIGGELTIQSMSTKSYLRIVLTSEADSMDVSGGKPDLFNNFGDDGMMDNNGDFGGFDYSNPTDKSKGDPSFGDNDFDNSTF